VLTTEGDMFRRLKESCKYKEPALLTMRSRDLHIDPYGNVRISEGTLGEGMGMRDLAMHTIENRAIQDIKHYGTPSSGTGERQLSNLGMSWSWDPKWVDNDNQGIYVFLHDSIGRTTVDGTVITDENVNSIPTTMVNGQPCVLVKSVLTSSKSRVLSEELISRKVLSQFNSKSSVAASILGNLSEFMTQSLLGLKHGGNVLNLGESYIMDAPRPGFSDKKMGKVVDGGRIYAPESGYLVPDYNAVMALNQMQKNPAEVIKDENGNPVNLPVMDYIFKGDSGKEYKYIAAFVATPMWDESHHYEAEELMILHYNLYTPSYQLDKIQKLIGTRGVPGHKTFSKNEVVKCMCRVPFDCVINYKGDLVELISGDNTIVTKRHFGATYFYPAGTQLHSGQRICTGVQDMRELFNLASNGVVNRPTCWSLFYLNARDLFDKVQAYVYELVFACIWADDADRVSSVVNNVREKSSFYNALSFESASKVLQSIDAVKGKEWEPDAFAWMLPSLFKSEI